MFLQNSRSPATEFCSYNTLNAKSHRDNHVKIIMVDSARYRSDTNSPQMMPELNSNICILLSLFRLYRLLVIQAFNRYYTSSLEVNKRIHTTFLVYKSAQFTIHKLCATIDTQLLQIIKNSLP